MNLEYVERVEDWLRASHLLYVRDFREPVHMSRRYGGDSGPHELRGWQR